MSVTEYRLSLDSERDDVIDFCNYVFSQAHVPHDFKTLLPKAYADHLPRLGAEHFIAVRDGHIRALVALRPLKMNILSRSLSVGYVGGVSVHPYARGEGHMKALMGKMMEYAREQGMDLLALGGNRQRYNWFGFESAGWTYRCTISKSSVKHAMKDVDESGISLSPLNGDDPDEMAFARDLAMSQKVVCDRPAEFFMDIMRSWNSKPRLIRFRGEMAGYVSGRVSELTLADNRLLLPALKKIYLEEMSDFTISCPPHERERLAAVSAVASGAAMTSVEMVNVLNWETTLQALLDLRASFNPLTDGRFTLQVDELPALTIEASGGKARVSRSNLPPDARFTHLEAERKLFGLDAFADGGLYGNWFPLPFWMTPMDTF